MVEDGLRWRDQVMPYFFSSVLSATSWLNGVTPKAVGCQFRIVVFCHMAPAVASDRVSGFPSPSCGRRFSLHTRDAPRLKMAVVCLHPVFIPRTFPRSSNGPFFVLPLSHSSPVAIVPPLSHGSSDFSRSSPHLARSRALDRFSTVSA